MTPQEQVIKDGYANYKNGKKINDVELAALIENHKNIIHAIDLIDDRKYDIFRNNIFLDLDQFELFQRNRNKK